MMQPRGDNRFGAWRIGAAALLVLGVPLQSAAIMRATERKPLPAFTVSASSGQPTASGTVSGEGRSLIVYVTPGNTSCDRLLAALNEWRSDALLTRLVVIVAGDLEAARTYALARVGSEGAAYRWYADVDGQARAALDLRDGPALVGIDKGIVEWSLTGVLNAPAAVESVVKNWLEQ